RIINDFAKKNENYSIKAGFVEGELLDVKGVEELAAIPTKEVLIARFMGSLRSSLYGFTYALQAIIDKNGEGQPAEEAAPAEAPAEA
ncbi:MAG: 50S ribosomal protein L10, partial [Clostridiales bacterium]